MLLLKELSSAISKLHLDLLTYFDPPSSSDQLDLKLKVEDLQVKSHMLTDKAEGDVLSMKVLLTLCKHEENELIGCTAGK